MKVNILNTMCLRDIKMLMNTHFDSLDCFTLILIGQPYLSSILEKPVHEALKQRIVIHYNYEGLSPEEAKNYIYSRIELPEQPTALLMKLCPCCSKFLPGYSANYQQCHDQCLNSWRLS